MISLKYFYFFSLIRQTGNFIYKSLVVSENAQQSLNDNSSERSNLTLSSKIFFFSFSTATCFFIYSSLLLSTLTKWKIVNNFFFAFWCWRNSWKKKNFVNKKSQKILFANVIVIVFPFGGRSSKNKNFKIAICQSQDNQKDTKVLIFSSIRCTFYYM